MSGLSRERSGTEVRVGVIGLGRPWLERYRPLLVRPGGPARVVVVYDPVVHRAELEADRLPCAAAEGITVLLDRDDVEAVFLLDEPWYGPWPIAAALARGKAVFCGGRPRAALDELAALPTDRLRDAPPVVLELHHRFAPETIRLRELLATTLGPPLRVSARMTAPAVERSSSDDDPAPALPLPADLAIALVDWCRTLFGSDPASSRLLRPGADSSDNLRVLLLDFPEGGSARLSIRLVPPNRPRPLHRLSVRTAKGRAWITPPGTLRWSLNPGGLPSAESFPPDPPTDRLVEHFLRSVRGESTLAPGLEELATLDRTSRLFVP
ncbi:Gfo/Idh/MocA family oxidoreductase [Tautonia sociabilis]|uniref:Gfo/Idh/MocA-like oxidoreductase N-terminal domain-containing protein n=1 Tax=Tautonia sociabilis TaxID=2080755 RepID=A0A432MFT6_9BACT|nr:Gfo/Idh/MocA family oxidoreductase [Tautonia sociabilis]RUL84985.1 hypothetical protein TsocGM_19265 [Tautonia sociabilis]